MKKDQQPVESRWQSREKRRKTNMILNTLIAIVVLLIIVVAVNIFTSPAPADSNDQAETVNSTVNDPDEAETASQSDSADKSAQIDSKEEKQVIDDEKLDDEDKEQTDEKTVEDGQDEQIVSEESNDPNVKKTIVNPSWEPVGTTQTGQPAQDYTGSGVDWNEMIQAIEYATGFDEGSGDILQRLENNGPQKAIGTIIKHDTKQKLRVYIEWVDKKGWKPVLVEELAA